MIAIIEALLPIFLIIVLGASIRHYTLSDEAVWRGVENLCYYLLFPALLIKTLASTQLGSASILAYSAALLFAVFSMAALLLLLQPWICRRLRASPAAFTSVFQGATRWHGFVALSIVGLLLDEEAIAYMAITMAVIIPPLNVINVWVLAANTEREKDFRQVLNQLLRNPFIIACTVGGGLNISAWGLPDPLFQLLSILGGGALGLALLAVGAGLRFRMALVQKSLVLTGTAIRLLGMPMLMLLGCGLFGVEGTGRTVAIIAGAVPTASSSFVLARQMGGDAPLMASLITVQVLAAAITLPTMIWLVG